MNASWLTLAACMRPGTFLPERPKVRTHDAVRICNRCDVRTPCLAASYKHPESYGIWGGLTRLERDLARPVEVVKKRRRAA